MAGTLFAMEAFTPLVRFFKCCYVNRMSSTISHDLNEFKVNLHTFSIFVIIEFNRLIKNMFDMLAIVSDIKQAVAMTCETNNEE